MTWRKFTYITLAAVFAVTATAAAVVLPHQVHEWTAPTTTQSPDSERLEYREGAARFIVTDIKSGSRGGVTVEHPAPKTASKGSAE